MNGQPAHSLYTTSNRGVNEVTPRENLHRILVLEDAGPIHRATTFDEKLTAERGQQDPQRLDADSAIATMYMFRRAAHKPDIGLRIYTYICYLCVGRSNIADHARRLYSHAIMDEASAGQVSVACGGPNGI